MKAKIILSYLVIFLLLSCNSSSVYSKFDLLPESKQWKQSDVKTFEFTIDNEAQLYDIVFKFSHVYDYQFASVPIDFTIENPAGEKEKITIDLKIKDASGKELGDCSGDICDLSLAIKNKAKLQKGKYSITIKNNFKGIYLPNVIGLGLDVDKTK